MAEALDAVLTGLTIATPLFHCTKGLQVGKCTKHRPRKISGVSFQFAVRNARKLEAYATPNATVIVWPMLRRSDTDDGPSGLWSVLSQRSHCDER